MGGQEEGQNEGTGVGHTHTTQGLSEIINVHTIEQQTTQAGHEVLFLLFVLMAMEEAEDEQVTERMGKGAERAGSWDLGLAIPHGKLFAQTALGLCDVE